MLHVQRHEEEETNVVGTGDTALAQLLQRVILLYGVAQENRQLSQ